MVIKMDQSEKRSYRRYAAAHAPSSATGKDMVSAFVCGGAICTLGQGITEMCRALGIGQETAKTLVPVTLIALSCLLTAFGVYGKLAAFAKAGTLVPITGFANAVCSEAIDAKSEGFVTGVGTKMFTIAGPVIVYGTAASVLWGIVYAIRTGAW